MSFSIDFSFDEDAAKFRAAPEHGRPVTFEVRRAYHRQRYVVGLAGSTGNGFSTHTSYETACRAALRRAVKYAEAYAVPRGIAS